MNKFYFLKFAATISILFVAGNGFAQQRNNNAPPALTAADYARAEKMLGYNTTPLVDYAGIRPNWLADNRFWYRSTTAAGSKFVLINAADGARQVFSDQTQLRKPAIKIATRTKSYRPTANAPLLSAIGICGCAMSQPARKRD
jgi:hypothetical protein